MAYNQAAKEKLRKMYVDNGEYVFESEEQAEEFISDVLWKAENQYHDEGYYHKYPTLESFLYSDKVDAIAHWTYSDDYEAKKV